MTDLMAWNGDATRMPYRMHSQYLQHLFLDNDLAEGRFLVDGRAGRIQRYSRADFRRRHQRDHVAPWRSTYKIHLQTETQMTYLLTTGGHNAGIEVGARKSQGAHFRMRQEDRGAIIGIQIRFLCRGAVTREGSWWPEWASWLKGQIWYTKCSGSLPTAAFGRSNSRRCARDLRDRSLKPTGGCPVEREGSFPKSQLIGTLRLARQTATLAIVSAFSFKRASSATRCTPHRPSIHRLRHDHPLLGPKTHEPQSQDLQKRNTDKRSGSRSRIDRGIKALLSTVRQLHSCQICDVDKIERRASQRNPAFR